MIKGIILFFIDLLIYYTLPPETAITIIVFASLLINTFTDVKWRYVDDQYVFQPIIFSGIYAAQNGLLPNFIIINLLIALFSVALFLIGAWSSGDITATISAGQILILFDNPLDSVIRFIAIFALVYFVSILAYATVKTKGKIFRRPSLISTIEGTFIVTAINELLHGYTLPVLLLISFISSKINKNITHVLGIVSLAYVIYTRTDPKTVLLTFIGMYIMSFIFSSTSGVQNFVFTKKIPAKMLKEGDVIKEMIVEKDGQLIIVPTTLKNIVKVKMNGAKIIVPPTSEGLTENDLKIINQHFPTYTFTVHKTIPIVPFILATIVLLFFPVL